MADKELWEIELEIKTDRVKEAQKKYDESLEKIKQGEKRLTASVMAEEKRNTAIKLSEIKLREAAVKHELTKEILDYKAAQQEKVRIRKQADAEIKAQQKADSRLTGQNVTLGSIDAINMQIAHYTKLRNSVLANSDEGKKYSGIISDLTAKKRELTGATGGLTGMIRGYGAGLIAAISIQTAFNTALNSAKFNVMREMFQGSEKDIQAFRDATANTVSDAGLIALSNQASDLNINLKDQAILFSFAETQADKYNTTTEEGFQKVFAIITGSTKGLKDLGITKSAFTKLTEELAQKQGKEVDEQIRLQAIIQLTNTTYDQAINKQMDQADMLETVKVQVKNVADEHGNFYDVLSSLNPVTGFFNIGLDDMAKKESKAKDDAMLLIGELDSFNSKIPGWGAGTQELRNYFISLAETFLTTANTAGMVQDALSGTSINRKGGNANVSTLGESKGKIKGTGTKHSGSGVTREIEEQLNLIKLQEAEYKKLETQLSKNLGDLGAERDIRLQMLDIEREIFRLRYGVTLGNLPDAKTIMPGSIPGMKHGFRLGSSNSIDPRGDYSGEDFQAIIRAEMEKQQAILSYTESMWTNFQGMLEFTGLMETDFGKIINLINSIIQGGKSAFGFMDAIGGLLSFLPGGGAVSSVIGGLSGGGGGGSMPFMGMPNNQPVIKPIININGELSALGTYKIVKTGNDMIAERGTGII